MTYADDTRALEIEWNRRCGSPGKQPINRTHPSFLQGQMDHYYGRSECPYLQNGEAARHWRAGWNDEADAAADRAERFRTAMETDRRRW